jgi:hypothetical protein
MLSRAKQRPTLFGLGFKIGHGFFVGWVEHPDVLMSSVGFKNWGRTKIEHRQLRHEDKNKAVF